MTKQCKNLMECVQAKIGNSKQPLFDGTEPYILYYSAFGDTDDADDNLLPYGGNIQDQKEVEVNKAYIKELDKYIGAKIVVPCKYSIPVLDQMKRRKRDELGNPIGE